MTQETSGQKERASFTDSWWGKIIIGLVVGESRFT